MVCRHFVFLVHVQPLFRTTMSKMGSASLAESPAINFIILFPMNQEAGESYFIPFFSDSVDYSALMALPSYCPSYFYYLHRIRRYSCQCFLDTVVAGN